VRGRYRFTFQCAKYAIHSISRMCADFLDSSANERQLGLPRPNLRLVIFQDRCEFASLTSVNAHR